MIGSAVRYLRRHHIGLLALAVAMGGTAYAANSINGRDVVDGSLKSRDLQNGTIQGRDVEGDSLGAAHVDESSLQDRVTSATVTSGQEPEFVDNDGFRSVSYDSTGIYTLASPEGERPCSFGASFVGLSPEQTGGGGSIGVVYLPDAVRVVLRDESGELVDLAAGRSGTGPWGFSIVAAC